MPIFFTPGSYPIEDYPGAAQQIARNIYGMADLRVPIVAVISEGGSGGAGGHWACRQAPHASPWLLFRYFTGRRRRHRGHVKGGNRATPELIEHCAQNSGTSPRRTICVLLYRSHRAGAAAWGQAVAF